MTCGCSKNRQNQQTMATTTTVYQKPVMPMIPSNNKHTSREVSPSTPDTFVKNETPSALKRPEIVVNNAPPSSLKRPEIVVKNEIPSSFPEEIDLNDKRHSSLPYKSIVVKVNNVVTGRQSSKKHIDSGVSRPTHVYDGPVHNNKDKHRVLKRIVRAKKT